MRTIAICNFKGGVGKTTTAVNIAYNLAIIHNKRVLVVDADSQGNMTYFYSQYKICNITTADVINQYKTAKQAIRRTKYSNLDIIPAGRDLDNMDDKTAYLLRYALTPIKDKYDYCIIDCQPSFSKSTISALTAADDVLIPVKPDTYGVNGLELMLDNINDISRYNPDLNMIAAIVTMYRKTNSIHSSIHDIVDKYSIVVFDSVIRAGEAANTSIRQRKPLTVHRSRDGITEDYKELTREYLERIGDYENTRHN